MIEYIKGSLIEIRPTNAIIEVNGIGYDLNISLSTYAQIENLKEVKLLVHEISVRMPT